MEFWDGTRDAPEPHSSSPDYRVLMQMRDYLYRSVHGLQQAFTRWNDPLDLGTSIPGFRSGDIERMPSDDDNVRLLVYPTDVVAQPEAGDHAALFAPRYVSLSTLGSRDVRDILDRLPGVPRMHYATWRADPVVLSGASGSSMLKKLAIGVWDNATSVVVDLARLDRLLAVDPTLQLGQRDTVEILGVLQEFVDILPTLDAELDRVGLIEESHAVELLQEMSDQVVSRFEPSPTRDQFVEHVASAVNRCLSYRSDQSADQLIATMSRTIGASVARPSLREIEEDGQLVKLKWQLNETVEWAGHLAEQLAHWSAPQPAAETDGRSGPLLDAHQCHQLEAGYSSLSQRLQHLIESFVSTRQNLRRPELSAVSVWAGKRAPFVSTVDATENAIVDLGRFVESLDQLDRAFGLILEQRYVAEVVEDDAKVIDGISCATFADLVLRTKSTLVL